MPKPMQLLVDIEEIAFGRVFRMLDTMQGVARLSIVGEGVKKAGAPNGGGNTGVRKGGSQTAVCLILGALVNSPGLSRPQLGAILEGNGKKAASLPDALQKLRKAKEITAKGKGASTRYDVTRAGRTHYQTACAIQPPEST